MDGVRESQVETRRQQRTVLITGASGFVGAALVQKLDSPTLRVRTTGRRAGVHHVITDLSSKTDWRAALEGVDAIVHAAGPAHARTPRDELQRAIVDGGAALARQAAAAGVRRFVFISSIRACLSQTTDAPANEDTPADPRDPYGQAKRDAELAIFAEEALRPIALRPPLVIGPRPKANLARFIRLLDTPLPLPFGGIANKRNIVSLDSLGEAVRLILAADTPATGVLHVCDHPAVSTSEMAALLRRGLGRPARLFQVPGFSRVAPAPLAQGLEVDDSRLRETFGYRGQDAREALIACGKAWVR